MRLSEITVEDLRADHDAFVAKMKEVTARLKEQGPPAPAPEYRSRHRPNWRAELASRSPFDDKLIVSDNS